MHRFVMCHLKVQNVQGVGGNSQRSFPKEVVSKFACALRSLKNVCAHPENKYKYSSSVDTMHICKYVRLHYSIYAENRILNFYKDLFLFKKLFSYPSKLFDPTPGTRLRNSSQKKGCAFKNEDMSFKFMNRNIFRRALNIYCWEARGIQQTWIVLKGCGCEEIKEMMQTNR